MIAKEEISSWFKSLQASICAQIEKADLLAYLPVLGHITTGLTHQPHRCDRRGFAAAGAHEAMADCRTNGAGIGRSAELGTSFR